jgi:hypothetical protein
MPAVLYLDTNHLSRLARSPTEPAVQAVRALLDSGEARLAISLQHLYELSDPVFVSRADVGAMLDKAPLVWAIHAMPDLFDREARSALDRVLTGSTTTPRVFYDDVRHAWNAPDVDFPPPSGMIEGFTKSSTLRQRVEASTGRGATLDRMMKTAAAVVRNPDGPLLSRLRDMQIIETQAGLVLRKPYPPEELLARAGGMRGFPAYHVYQALTLTRLRDTRFPTVANDLVDEWHALYSPYAAVTALDRATVGRCRSAKLPHISRITARLEDVPGILSRT